MFSGSYNSYAHNLCNSHLSTNCSARVTIPTRRVQLLMLVRKNEWGATGGHYLPKTGVSQNHKGLCRMQLHTTGTGTAVLASEDHHGGRDCLYWGETA